jgi:hypothetical protein
MKRTLICAALALGVATLPLVSEARGDDHGPRGGYGYGHGGYGHGYDRGYHGGGYRGGYHGGGGVWPWLLGAAAVGAVVGVASQPYYGGGTVYYDAPPPPPPPPTVYYGVPSYGYVTPPQTCTYYPDGSSYCR